MKVDGLVLLADGECRRLADLGVDGMAVDLFYRGMVGVAADYERCPIARAIAAEFCNTLCDMQHFASHYAFEIVIDFSIRWPCTCLYWVTDRLRSFLNKN